MFRAGVHEALLRAAPRLALLRRGGLSLANLACALLFAAAHGLLRSWPLALAVFAPALLLGWLYERRRRLWPCIAAHAAMNSLWFLAAPWAGAVAALL